MKTSWNFSLLRFTRLDLRSQRHFFVRGLISKMPVVMFLLAASLHAGVITEEPQDWSSTAPQISGFAQTLGSVIYFDLWNLPGDRNDQVVTLTFAEPVLGFGGAWDNRPQDPGTGICVMGDCFGDAVSFVGFRGWISDVPFQSIVIYTQMAHPGVIRERGLLYNILVLPASNIPTTELPDPPPPFELNPLPQEFTPLSEPLTIVATPEPASWILVMSGLGLLSARGVRRATSASQEQERQS